MIVGALATTVLLSGCSASGPASSDAGSDSPAVTVSTGSVPRVVDGWPTAAPAKLGFRPQRLAAMARDAKRKDSTCFAVVRKGKLAGDWNWGTPRLQPREVFSVTKSVTSTLVGIAVRDGSLALDDRVSTYVPAWRGTESRAVTVRNLLSNDSGRFWSVDSDYVKLLQAADRSTYAVRLGQQYAPGTTWAYNNAAIQVLDRVIAKATGMTTADFAAERLFTPLGMTHTRMTPDTSGRSTNAFFGLQTTCLDLARFARLYLERGKVGPRRILAAGYVKAATGRSSTKLNAAYGYLWWLNRYGELRGATDQVDPAGQPVTEHQGRLVPGAPVDLFSAIGLGGQIAMVDPGSRTIVVRIGPAKASTAG
ncbi:serine hydrolase domain-containing protein, partial [Nocardioides hankookensis]